LPDRLALDGALTFARFAYPPNHLGYCGPDVNDELLQRVSAGAADQELRTLAQGFEGAWPYLELIATCNKIDDPLDRRVVEAYWIGNRLLDRVDASTFADSLASRFGPQLAHVEDRDRLLAPLRSGAQPHHGFHVFGVYPWVGLLRTGAVDSALFVLDRCRVRWGRVASISDDQVVVVSRPLTFDGTRLDLGEPREEVATQAARGYRLTPDLAVGDWCALHWNWVCMRLDRRQLAALHHCTRRELDAVNGVRFPAPASVLA